MHFSLNEAEQGGRDVVGGAVGGAVGATVDVEEVKRLDEGVGRLFPSHAKNKGEAGGEVLQMQKETE